MQKFYKIILCLLCLLACFGTASADTVHMTDGKVLNGEIIQNSMDDSGFILKLPDGKYTERIPWNKLTQDDLKDLQLNSRAAEFVQPLIIQTQEEKMKKTEIEVKDVPRLKRPAKASLVGSMFGSSMGLFIILIFVAANVYAGYEIAQFRGHPTMMVAGLSFIAPILAPAIFLGISKPLKISRQSSQAAHNDELAAVQADIAAADAAVGGGGDAPVESASSEQEQAPRPVTSKLPPARKFARGQFTFNRRFFETQMPAYFAVNRPETERNNVLAVKSSRGSFIAERIVRIAAGDVTFQVFKGNASEEVIVPFLEIQEVVIRHKDAPDA